MTRHFQYKVIIIIDGPLGKAKYPMRIEFQETENPHGFSMHQIWKIKLSPLSLLKQKLIFSCLII